MKENFFGKSKENIKKTILVGATTLLSLAPNQKISSQVVDTLDTSSRSELQDTSAIERENGRVLNLIDNLEKKLQEKSDKTSNSEKPVFAIVALDDIDNTLQSNANNKIPAGYLREELIVEFFNNKQNEDKSVIARDIGALRQIDEEFLMVKEGYIDIKDQNNRIYVRPDYYIVIESDSNKDSDQISAKIFSLNDEKLLDTITLDTKNYAVQSYAQDGITNSIVTDFNSLIEARVSQL